MTSTHKRIVDPLDPQYRGVGGWLAVLIISLTLLSPLALLSGMLKESEYWARYVERAPGLPAIIRISNIMEGCVIAFSVFAGIGLWTKWPKAVRVAKIFLISGLIVSIVRPFLPLTVNLPESLHDKILDEVWYSMPPLLIYTMVWYAYLTYSKKSGGDVPFVSTGVANAIAVRPGSKESCNGGLTTAANLTTT